MIGLLCFALAVLASPFKSKSRLEAENAVLRHQLILLRRRVRGRAQPTNNDRWFLVQMYRWFPSILTVVTIVQPETLVRWHRADFRYYWRWKSNLRGGRPPIESELRALVRQMSTENQLWGAPRIHGVLGFSVAQSSVGKYMVERRGPPSQGWRTFLRNHAPDIAAMDLFVVPTIGFELLYDFVIVRIDRRDLVWINVTTNPTAERIARQITEAFPWDSAPGYMIRDRDRIYGAAVTRRLRAMGIRDKPIAPASLAEWLCRAVDQIDPARVFGPYRHPGRGAFASNSKILCRLLQFSQNASDFAQGCADFSSGPTDRNHSLTPDPRRASPLLRPDLSFRYTMPESDVNKSRRIIRVVISNPGRLKQIFRPFEMVHVGPHLIDAFR
jgi:hypothetical protein